MQIKDGLLTYKSGNCDPFQPLVDHLLLLMAAVRCYDDVNCTNTYRVFACACVCNLHFGKSIICVVAFFAIYICTFGRLQFIWTHHIKWTNCLEWILLKLNIYSTTHTHTQWRRMRVMNEKRVGKNPANNGFYCSYNCCRVPHTHDTTEPRITFFVLNR